jgi:hypothetical protein
MKNRDERGARKIQCRRDVLAAGFIAFTVDSIQLPLSTGG